MAYLKAVLPKCELGMIEELASAGKGLNFAHLKELAIASYVYGRQPKKTVSRLLAQANEKSAGFDDNSADDEDEE